MAIGVNGAARDPGFPLCATAPNTQPTRRRVLVALSATAGTAASVTGATLTQDVVAISFGQKGLMAGLAIEGSEITQIHPGQ